KKFVGKVMSYHYGGITTSPLGSGDWLEAYGLYATVCGASAKRGPIQKLTPTSYLQTSWQGLQKCE
ncbi:hypothetical protein RJZ56_006298, partial [Blastomyces dermatitidis]